VYVPPNKISFKNHLKLEVHRQIHMNVEGCRVVTLQGEEVCLVAWRHIMGLPETTFYRYAGYTCSVNFLFFELSCEILCERNLFSIVFRKLQVVRY
jgi:hypothetical protein